MESGTGPPPDIAINDAYDDFEFDFNALAFDQDPAFAFNFDDESVFWPPSPPEATNQRCRKVLEAENLARSIRSFSDLWDSVVQERGKCAAHKTVPRTISVLEKIYNIVGIMPCQKELLTIRTGLFGSVLPPPSREEKRQKKKNIEAFERFKTELLTLLERHDIQKELVEIVINRRCSAQQTDILCHVLEIQ
ncbi:hypothetical protein TRFO_35966 [Tritrichomonas foetus]|uniref:Uncharacterized protein n=1 Tax=Tritrichomonas foetus TaxID=1144522 RepID=A0A1J4JF58_9EUKA|nr:hypothetical protein TRFO_35966 [Tritrichomonas foetus]|eukprot:OHS97728.1 hypothetical protein TRFO_35966 [Tritrichomonas foetus]